MNHVEYIKPDNTNDQLRDPLLINSIDNWWWMRLTFESYIIQEFLCLNDQFQSDYSYMKFSPTPKIEKAFVNNNRRTVFDVNHVANNIPVYQ